MGSGWPSAVLDGVALAATVAEDRGAAAALPGFASPWRDAVAGRAGSVAALEGAARARELRRIAAALRPAPRADAAERLPARARALLATEVERAVGAVWLTSAPPPRRGFNASTALRSLLARLAAQPARHDAALAGRERGMGRMTLAQISIDLGAEPFAAVAVLLGEEEAAAVLAMLTHAQAEPWAEGRRRRARVLLGVVLAVAQPIEITRMLGAMELGSTDPEGDARSASWRRAGAEIASLAEGGA